MTVSVAQERNSSNSASGSSISLAFLAAISAGDAIHVFGSNDTSGSADISSFSDGTNTYGAVLDDTNDTNNAQRLAHCVASNCAAGTPTVAVNYSASTQFRAIWIKDITGCSASPLDGHHANWQTTPGTGTDAVTSGTATNSNQPALIDALSLNTNTTGETLSAGTGFSFGAHGWTTIYAGSTNEAASESKRITTTTAVAATYTLTTGVPMITAMAIFDEAAPPSTFPVPDGRPPPLSDQTNTLLRM